MDTLNGLVTATSDFENGVEITIYWTDGRESGTTTVFWRLPGSYDWAMKKRVNNELTWVYPWLDADWGVPVIYMGFDTTTRVYNIFGDGTGYFANADMSNIENFNWYYEAYNDSRIYRR